MLFPISFFANRSIFSRNWGAHQSSNRTLFLTFKIGMSKWVENVFQSVPIFAKEYIPPTNWCAKLVLRVSYGFCFRGSVPTCVPLLACRMVKPGDNITMGDPICKFESDKVRMSAMIWMTAPQMGSCMANGIFVVGVASLRTQCRTSDGSSCCSSSRQEVEHAW